MMRQPVGVGVERGVAQRAVLEHHRDRIRRARSLRGEQRRQGRRPATGRARCRSSPAGWCRARSAPGSRSGRARGPGPQPRPPAAGSAAPPSASTVARRTGRWRIPARRRCRPARRRRRAARPARPTGRTSRSRVATGSGAHRKPGSSSVAAPACSLERQHHLEQRMPRQRARRVEHLDQPLERQLLVAVGRKVAAPHPADQLAEARLPEVSVRSTSVLTKNPTRSSSAASVRPAIGLPIAMSVPAPSRVSSAGQTRPAAP